jgi:ubiquinol-cytochrome c reductase cytochrome b subunit
VIPGTLLALVGVHLWMVLRLGINDWPMPGCVVRKSTYVREYHELAKQTGIPFIPDAAWKDAIFAVAIMLSVIACALFFGPFGPTGQPDPTIIDTAPRPDIAFLWIYAVLAYLPPSLETPFMFIAPVVVIVAMLLLPLVGGEGEKHWSRRPVAVLMLAVIAVTLGVFTHLGTYTPWSPIMGAWSGLPTPVAYLQGRTPLERQGAIVFQQKQCRNCHSIGGAGGLRGPTLDAIAARMTEDQMYRQVLQGGGNMPAYGNALSPAETTALVRFLATLHGNDLPTAIDASRRMVTSNETPATTGGH